MSLRLRSLKTRLGSHPHTYTHPYTHIWTSFRSIFITKARKLSLPCPLVDFKCQNSRDWVYFICFYCPEPNTTPGGIVPHMVPHMEVFSRCFLKKCIRIFLAFHSHPWMPSLDACYLLSELLQ